MIIHVALQRGCCQNNCHCYSSRTPFVLSSVLETFLASRYFVIILICFPDSYHDPNNVEIEIKLSARCPTSLSSPLPPEQFIIGTRIFCLILEL